MKIQLKLIVYGKNSFQKENFRPVVNSSWCKPKGGLWASPVDSEWGWKEWCLSEEFETTKLNNHFLLNYSGNTLKINCLEDTQQMIWLEQSDYFYKAVPDFEQMRQEGIDAIWLTPQGENETRFNRDYSLYGWDCESVLVMNPDCLSVPALELNRNIEF